MPERSRSEISRRRFIRDAGLGVAALSMPGLIASREAASAQTAEPDAFHSGAYIHSYAEEVADARSRGY